MTLSSVMRSLFLSFTALLILSACGGVMPYKAPVTQGIVVSEAMLQDLQPGLTQQQVRQLLGPNYGENPFKPQHWEYIFTSTNPNIHAESVKHLILRFDAEGYLIDWQQR